MTTPTIQTNGNQHHFFIGIPILGHVLVHSDDKTRVLVVTVELIWLFFLNIYFFNFVPTPNKSFRFTRFRISYVNHTAIILTNHWLSYTVFFSMCAVQSGPVPFFRSCLSRMIVHLRNLFYVKHKCCSNVVGSKVGKQTKRCEIVTHKYIKTDRVKHCISLRTTFSPYLHLVGEETLECLPILQH